MRDDTDHPQGRTIKQCYLSCQLQMTARMFLGDFNLILSSVQSISGLLEIMERLCQSFHIHRPASDSDESYVRVPKFLTGGAIVAVPYMSCHVTSHMFYHGKCC